MQTQHQTLRHAILALAFLSTLNFQSSRVLAQGSLTPPGVPAPTMKSLAQVEPRTPISSAPFTISTPGSYYLTTNVTTAVSNAIVIAANGVTLDLGGFTISSSLANAANGGTAILLNNGVSDIVIKNGKIRSGVTNNGSNIYSGSGFANGIFFSSTLPVDVRVSGVSISGCLNFGIYLGGGNSTVVEGCVVRTTGQLGLGASTINKSVVMDCGSIAILGEQVSDCRGESTGSDSAIVGTTVMNCYGVSTDGPGVNAKSAQNCYGTSVTDFGLTALTALNCYGVSSNNYGITASTAENCFGFSTSGFGLQATIALNCYGTTSGSSAGLAANSAQNCYGSSNGGFGVYANTTQNCQGTSSSGTGLFAIYTATGCLGTSSTGIGLHALNASFCTGARNNGTAIQATIATGCIAYSGTNMITTKYNMP
jgi:hypothetical protein